MKEKKSEKHELATVVGFVIIFVSVLFSQTNYEREKINWFAVAILLLLNIINCKWVMNIARNLKRSTLFWGVFAFIFPPVALIIIGSLTENIPYKINPEEHLLKKDNRVKIGDIYLEEEDNNS